MMGLGKVQPGTMMMMMESLGSEAGYSETSSPPDNLCDFGKVTWIPGFQIAIATTSRVIRESMLLVFASPLSPNTWERLYKAIILSIFTQACQPRVWCCFLSYLPMYEQLLKVLALCGCGAL